MELLGQGFLTPASFGSCRAVPGQAWDAPDRAWHSWMLCKHFCQPSCSCSPWMRPGMVPGCWWHRGPQSQVCCSCSHSLPCRGVDFLTVWESFGSSWVQGQKKPGCHLLHCGCPWFGDNWGPRLPLCLLLSQPWEPWGIAGVRNDCSLLKLQRFIKP